MPLNTETITTSTAPWGPLQDPLKFGFGEARGLYEQGGPQYFPGSTVQQFGQDTTGAMDLYRNQALAGTPLAQAAPDELAKTLQGGYLSPESNPYLKSMYDAAAQNVSRTYSEATAPTTAAQFGLAGRTGSNMAFANRMQQNEDQLGDTLGNLAAQLYGGAYENERGRMMQAGAMSPQVAPLAYYDAGQLMNDGQMGDELGQRNINDEFNRFMFEQEQPYDNLARYFGSLGKGYGSSSQQTAPLYNQPDWVQNLGLGVGAFGLLEELGLFS